MELSNSYLSLGETFYQRIAPEPVTSPSLFLWNETLADDLGLPQPLREDAHALAELFSGNRLFPDSTPIALAYAGHQFGHFSPQLGDGRAHLLGQVQGEGEALHDIQLKGSGRTRFSRNGDGRCALGPAIREYIMSEAMAALGIPTTRTLAVVTTGDAVYREVEQPGAVVTRIAASHLRVGSFEYFYAQKKMLEVETLCDYAIKRHFPELASVQGEERYIQFLQKVFDRQIELLCHWMRVGFIHGVMNTDNTAISGETIDYGPCAMMGAYSPNTVFSSIDSMGRYRFGNQPGIAQWNMARLAECLLPLMSEDAQRATARAENLLSDFGKKFQQRYQQTMAAKLGLTSVDQDDEKLITVLMDSMRRESLDYTQTFHQLTRAMETGIAPDALQEPLGDWLKHWQKRLKSQRQRDEDIGSEMRLHNPVVIPRNHHMEAVIESCITSGSPDAAERFLEVLRAPYVETEHTSAYQDAPSDGDRNYQTFCGT